MTLLERIIDKYIPEPNTGCWLWIAASFKDGYGGLRIRGKTYKAHRISFEVFNGPIPPDTFVCHKCDTKACINPAHLFLGTDLDNIWDMISKGRNPKGSKHGKALLTEDHVLKIRKDIRPSGVIAPEYGVKKATITGIRSRRAWKHI